MARDERYDIGFCRLQDGVTGRDQAIGLENGKFLSAAFTWLSVA